MFLLFLDMTKAVTLFESYGYVIGIPKIENLENSKSLSYDCAVRESQPVAEV